MKQLFLFVWHLPRHLLMGLVWIYQKLLSPDHSFWAKSLKPYGHCKFHPSCSQYMKESLKKNGVILGLPKGIWRILRCNPWSEGGVDPA